MSPMARALECAFLVTAALAAASPVCDGDGDACPESRPEASAVLLAKSFTPSFLKVREEPLALLGVAELAAAADRRDTHPEQMLAQGQQLVSALRSMEEGANGTSGLSGSDKESLMNVSVLLEMTMVANLRAMHVEDVGEAEAAYNVVAQCDTDRDTELLGPAMALGAAVTAARRVHSDCRTEESTLASQNTTDYTAYQGLETSIPPPPSCPASSNKIAAMESFFDPDANAYLSWYQTNYPLFKAKKEAFRRSSQAASDMRANCSSLQHTFEAEYCAYRSKLESLCGTYSDCHKSALASYRAMKERVSASVTSRKSLYKSAITIVCHIKVILEHNKTHDECEEMSKSIDTSEFDLTFKIAPSATACSTDAVKKDTCDAAWISTEYGSLPTNVQAAACSKCESASVSQPTEPVVIHEKHIMSVSSSTTANTDYWAFICPAVPPAATLYIKVQMGDAVDYFRPKAGESYCSMLSSNNKHQWASSPSGPWVDATSYDSHHLGGGQFPGAKHRVAYWGSSEKSGGCCVNDKWGQSFDMYYGSSTCTEIAC